MNVYVSLDEKSYDRKPVKEIVTIKYRAVAGWQKIGLSDLADLVGNEGHAMVPGHLEGGIGAENCTAMQLFALDFDGGCRFEEIKEKCDFLGIPIAFAYHTYSSSEKEERFRVVFAHKTLIEDPFVIKVVLNVLHKIFPESDSACKNLDRLFLGGKELIYVDENARVALVQLLTPFYEAMSVGENRKRNIRSFCNQQKILMYNDRAGMDAWENLPLYGEIDGITDRAIIHSIGESANPSFFVLESKGLHQGLTCRMEMRRLSITGDSNCQLLNDFSSGEWLDHQARFALLTNLRHIYGGQKHFLEIMELYYDLESCEKWKRDIRQMPDYHPQRCSSEFCPYYTECSHKGTIVDTLAMDRRVHQEKTTYYSLEEAHESLRKNLEEALSSPNQGIHLIKAQTAIGKTTSYIDLIKSHPQQKFLVALPTNLLKREVYENMRTKGIPEREIFMTVSTQGNAFFPFEIQEAIAEAHERGLHNKTKKLVQDYYKEIEKRPDKIAVAEECRMLLKGTEAFLDKRVIVTTHAYLLQLPESTLKEYTVIIDEDILQLQILNKVSCIYGRCLEELVEKGIPVYGEIAGRMLRANENEYQIMEGAPYAVPLTEEKLEELEYWGGNNINDLRFARAFVKQRVEDSEDIKVTYFCPQKMHTTKYMILSATLNEDIYRKYFEKQMKVYSYPEKKAAYRGNLIQYTYHSLGRRDLSKKMQVFDYVRSLAGNPKLEIITFKEGASIRGVSKMNSKGLHFGNAIGVNGLKGQDLGIVGTPYKVELADKLAACYLGADVNQEADQRPRPRRVSYKGCSFLITTYQDLLLREIQLYGLESELEQCVGRARLLREDCTVYVLSAFPCEQAEIRMEDYLEE